jgi:probable F420-dependent oxidoreductase
MTPQRPFRFGVLAFGATSRDAWVSTARKAEDLGYATFLVDDHLSRRFAPIAALAAAAEATHVLRVGSCVFGNDFRHPVVLAKEAASLDVLSGGRFELGIGTGYERADYDQTGIPLDPPGVRVSRLAEAVQIIKGAFADAPFSFAGRYYTIRALNGLPKPLQRPHPLIFIGGGSRRILSIAAQEADIVGINVKTTAAGGFDVLSITPDATAQKVAWVRHAAGARFAALELQLLVPFMRVTDNRYQAAAQFVQAWQLTEVVRPEHILDSPHALIGTVDQIVEDLLARRECYGVSYVAVFEEQMDMFAPIVARLAGI